MTIDMDRKREIMEIAKGYSVLSEFMADHRRHYSYAFKYGYYREVISHMHRKIQPPKDYAKGRRCTVCLITKDACEFELRKSHEPVRRSQCRPCRKAANEAWVRANPESRRRTAVKRHKAFPEVAREGARKRRQMRPESVAARDLLRRVLKLTGQSKETKTEEALGYRFHEIRAHLEAQFEEGMSWANWGEWHIDHIKSVAEFYNEGQHDPKVINALSNLRPLWAADNLARNRSRLEVARGHS